MGHKISFGRAEFFLVEDKLYFNVYLYIFVRLPLKKKKKKKKKLFWIELVDLDRFGLKHSQNAHSLVDFVSSLFFNSFVGRIYTTIWCIFISFFQTCLQKHAKFPRKVTELARVTLYYFIKFREEAFSILFVINFIFEICISRYKMLIN